MAFCHDFTPLYCDIFISRTCPLITVTEKRGSLSLLWQNSKESQKIISFFKRSRFKIWVYFLQEKCPQIHAPPCNLIHNQLKNSTFLIRVLESSCLWLANPFYSQSQSLFLAATLTGSSSSVPFLPNCASRRSRTGKRVGLSVPVPATWPSNGDSQSYSPLAFLLF